MSARAAAIGARGDGHLRTATIGFDTKRIRGPDSRSGVHRIGVAARHTGGWTMFTCVFHGACLRIRERRAHTSCRERCTVDRLRETNNARNDGRRGWHGTSGENCLARWRTLRSNGSTDYQEGTGFGAGESLSESHNRHTAVTRPRRFCNRQLSFSHPCRIAYLTMSIRPLRPSFRIAFDLCASTVFTDNSSCAAISLLL